MTRLVDIKNYKFLRWTIHIIIHVMGEINSSMCFWIVSFHQFICTQNVKRYLGFFFKRYLYIQQGDQKVTSNFIIKIPLTEHPIHRTSIILLILNMARRNHAPFCCSKTAIGARVSRVEIPICWIVLCPIITLRSNTNNA